MSKFDINKLNAVSSAVGSVEQAFEQPAVQPADAQPSETLTPSVPADEEWLAVPGQDADNEPSVEKPVRGKKAEAPSKSKKKVVLKKEDVKIVNILVPKKIYKKMMMIQLDRNVPIRQLGLELIELGLEHYDPSDYEE